MESHHFRLIRSALFFLLPVGCGEAPYASSPTPSVDEITDTDPVVRAALLDTDDPDDPPEGDIVGSGFW